MADINKIVEANSIIDNLKIQGIPLDKIDPIALSQQTPDLDFQKDLVKVVETQRLSQALFGTSINLGAVSRVADCIKNIDDIIVEKIKAKIINEISEAIRANSGGTIDRALSVINKLQVMAQLAISLYNRAKSTDDMSLVELLLLAKNAGVLDRIKYFKIIQEKYGTIVGNINELLTNIASLDICSIPNYGPNGQRLSFPLTVNTAAPTALPNFSPPITVDNNSVQIKGAYEDVLRRIGDIASSRDNIV